MGKIRAPASRWGIVERSCEHHGPKITCSQIKVTVVASYR